MIFEVWFTLAMMATFSVVMAYVSRNPIAFLVSGLLWLILAWNCADIEFIITYTNSDYLKDFRYPYLVTLFSLIGLSNLILFVFGVFEMLKAGGEEATEGRDYK